MTEWKNFRLAQIWEMVRREQLTAGDKQSAGWRNTATLCEEQAEQLQTAANQLAVPWPPTPNSAAEAFQLWVRSYVTSKRRSAAAARANSETIKDITHQMTTARDQVFSLLLQAQRYEAWRPPVLLLLGQTLPGQPPPGWREDLDRQAQDIMAHTEIAVTAQAARIQHPGNFGIVSFGEPGTPVGGIPAEATQTGERSGGSPIGTFIPKPTFPAIPPPVNPAVAPDLESPSQESLPNLAGSIQQQHSPSTRIDGMTSPYPYAPLASPQTHTALSPSEAIGLIHSPNQINPRSPAGTQTTPSSQAATRSNSGVVPIQPIPPGAPNGQSTSIKNPTNPRPGSRRGVPHDPRDPWAVPQGGPAVIEPAPEPTFHDPGAGVIGFDR